MGNRRHLFKNDTAHSDILMQQLGVFFFEKSLKDSGRLVTRPQGASERRLELCPLMFHS